MQPDWSSDERLRGLDPVALSAIFQPRLWRVTRPRARLRGTVWVSVGCFVTSSLAAAPPLRKGGRLIDASGRWLVGAKGDCPF